MGAATDTTSLAEAHRWPKLWPKAHNALWAVATALACASSPTADRDIEITEAPHGILVVDLMPAWLNGRAVAAHIDAGSGKVVQIDLMADGWQPIVSADQIDALLADPRRLRALVTAAHGCMPPAEPARRGERVQVRLSDEERDLLAEWSNDAPTSTALRDAALAYLRSLGLEVAA